MHVLFPCICLLALVTLSSADLLSTLKMVHKSPAFHQLPDAEQNLLIELIGETEAHQLHAFIQHVTMDPVFQLLAHLPEHEASVLLKYLNAELVKESHQNTNGPAMKGR